MISNKKTKSLTQFKQKKSIFGQFNIIKQCRKYELSPWQCPQFLFLIMGLIIIVSVVLVYMIGANYIEDPLIIALLVIFIAIILFIISVIITQSFERLAEANRMKSEFVGIVSHQLRSPLSNLKWVIEFLMSGKFISASEKQLEYFRILKENSDRMTILVSDLLIVLKIEQNQIFLKKEDFSLKKLIEEVIKNKESLSEAFNIKIDFSYEKDLPKIKTDYSQVKIIFENILDNAIRYVQKKGKVEVDLRRKNNKFYIKVKDSGIGIPKDDQKYIFHKFFRSDNIKRHQTEGSGLGLYIARSIIYKLGGKIEFESQEGIGSTFWLIFP